MSSPYREISAALQRFRTRFYDPNTPVTIEHDRFLDLLDALEQAAQALHLAPRGADPAATGVWWHHERGPALARLADALAERTQTSHLVELATEQQHDLAAAQALQRSLQDRPVR